MRQISKKENGVGATINICITVQLAFMDPLRFSGPKAMRYRPGKERCRSGAKFENLSLSEGGLGRTDLTVRLHTSRLREALSYVNKHSSGHKPRTLDRDYLYFIILKNK